MKCSKCKKKVSTSAKYCPYCQNPLCDDETSKPESVDANNWGQQSINVVDTDNMKKTKIMIAVFSAIIVICIVAFIFIYTFYRDFSNSIIPGVTDEERQAALLNEASEEIDEIYDGYYNEEISYEEAVENLNEIESSDDSSIQDLVANCQERIDKIKQSRLNYQLGEEAYAEQNYMEALTYYYAVDAIDELYYEKTKEKITIVTQEYKDYELAVADAYYQAQAYQSAVICLINAEDVFKDDTSFVENLRTLRTEYIEKWIESQREKHLYFTGDSLEEGAVYLAYFYDLPSLDPDYDLQSIIEEGYEWESNVLLSKINEKRQEMGMTELAYNSQLKEVAQTIAEEAYNNIPADENGVKDLSLFSSYAGDDIVKSYLDLLFPDWQSCKKTVTLSYSCAKNFFEGNDPFFSNPDKLTDEEKELYADNPYEAYGVFDSEHVYFGVGIVFDKATQKCVWVILSGS